jgi:hypothetical protein
MFSILVGENEVNRKLGRPKSKWDYNLDLKEWDVKKKSDLSASGQVPIAGCCEYDS